MQKDKLKNINKPKPEGRYFSNFWQYTYESEISNPDRQKQLKS